MTTYTNQELSAVIESLVRTSLGLGEDVTLRPDSDLINEVGLDSIEAFELVATLHDLLGARIPEDLDPKSIATIKALAQYLLDRYSEDVISKFMSIDIQAELAARVEDELA